MIDVFDISIRYHIKLALLDVHTSCYKSGASGRRAMHRMSSIVSRTDRNGERSVDYAIDNEDKGLRTGASRYFGEFGIVCPIPVP